MRRNGWHHRLWWQVSDKLHPLCRLWRPYCWVAGHEEFVDMDGRTRSCVICLKALK